MSRSAPCPHVGAMALYRSRDAEHTVLHQVVAEHLEAFLEAVAEAGGGAGLPQFVEREFRKFLGGVVDGVESQAEPHRARRARACCSTSTRAAPRGVALRVARRAWSRRCSAQAAG